MGRETRKRAAAKAASKRAKAVQRCHVHSLPDELLQRVLCNLPLNIERWSELATVCKRWKSTMYRLVPADFVVRTRSDLRQLEASKVKIGSFTVKDAGHSTFSLACMLRRSIGSRRLDPHNLQSVNVEVASFFNKMLRFGDWLPFLTRLHKLHLALPAEKLCEFLGALPQGLRDLGLRVRTSAQWTDRDVVSSFERISRLSQLQTLTIKTERELTASVETLVDHSERLSALLSASAELLGMEEAARHPWKFVGSSKKRLVFTKGSDGEDSGDDQLVSPKRCTAQGSASHRIDVIGNMAAAALGRAQLLKMLAGEQGGPTIDCLHVLLHALQWHLALAMAMELDQPGQDSPSQELQELWATADIGSCWLDLRSMSSLTSVTIHGLPTVWLPSGLQKLYVDSPGYTGPLPSGLTKYTAKLVASSGLTQWELRPLGLLPLTELDVAIRSSEERCRRDFCFKILQGAHSLQLHSHLQRLCLVTDRDLHLDAQISHHLLTLLAQHKQLRRLEIGSGFYRLQGDSIPGKGVAALNLLSDLKDHCGWQVEHTAAGANQQAALPSGAIAVTMCEPPGPQGWPFLLQEPPRDFVSDFE